MDREIKKNEIENYEDEIDLVDLLKILIKNKCLILLTIIIITVISLGVGIVKYNSGKKVSTIISYNFNEISEGLNPDKSKFNSKLIVSNEVLNGVIKDLGLEGKEEINIVDIREKISVIPIVPGYVKAKIKSELEGGQNSSFNASAYEVRMEIIKDSNMTKKILQAIVARYSNYYSERYAQSDMISTLKIGGTYEYQDYLKAFESKLKDIEYILKSKKDQGFVSKQNGLGFANILNKIQLIRDLDIIKVQQYLSIDGISKNKEIASKNLDYQIKKYQSNRQKKVNEVETLNDILKLYKPESNKVMVSGNTGTVLEQNPNEYYSKLIEKVAIAAVEIGNIDQDIKDLEDRKENINNSDDKNKKALEEALVDLENNVNDIAISTNNLLKEYNDRFITNYVKVISPVDEIASTKKSIMIVVVGIMLGLFLGIMLAFMKEFFANIDLKK